MTPSFHAPVDQDESVIDAIPPSAKPAFARNHERWTYQQFFHE
jgi:hypothetical protein